MSDLRGYEYTPCRFVGLTCSGSGLSLGTVRQLLFLD
jgi:hypothetical protein